MNSLVALFPEPLMQRWFAVITDATIRGSLLILGALICVTLLLRRGAAVRSFIWHTSLGAMLLVPVLSAMLPPWRSGIAAAALEWSVAAMPAPVKRVMPRAEARSRGTADRSGAATPTVPSTTAAAGDTALNTSRPTTRHGGIVALFLVWLGGVAFCLHRLVRAAARLILMEREARSVTDARVMALVAGHARALRVGRRVRILQGRSGAIPMTWGLLRPRLLLPAQWQSWPETVLSAVVQHELAHVRRHDLAAQLLGDVAQVLFWFNPLVWLARRQAHVAREQACDDEVIHRGASPAAYAEALLDLVRLLRPSASAPRAALALGRSQELARRIDALLDDARSRRRLTGRAAATTIVVVAIATGAIAAIAPSEARSAMVPSRRGVVCCPDLEGPVALGEPGRALDRAFAKLAADGFSGAVLVAAGDRVVFAKGLGLADRERRIPSTVTTRFHVGGVTKALTALAVLDLVDRGRLELHEPVTRYLPALRGPVGAITIHQLLTHTDGLPELPDLTSGPSSLLAALQAARPAFETGQSYGSTNTGHALLALVVEQVAGRPFERYVREHQLAPAGMTRSFLRTEGVQLDDVAVGYADNARPTRPAPDETSARGSLGLVTTVGDLHRWFDAFIGGRLVSPRVVRTMLTPYLRTAKPFEQGYGWLLYDSTTARPFRSGPLPLVRRSGREPGFEAEVVHDRNAGWIAIVLVNSDVLMRHRAIETVRMVMDRTGTDAKPPPLIVRR